MNPPRIAFITLTNAGYVAYTRNCLRSLQKIGITNLKCYAIGERAYRMLARENFDVVHLPDETNTNFQAFRRGNWAAITFYKFRIIHENLLEYDYVCFTDGDIVFKNPQLFDYCRGAIGTADLLAQNDGQEDTPGQDLCSGFMFIRSNERTRKYFDPAYVAANSDMTVGWDDQVYVNAIKDQLDYRLLPLPLFPNGKYFRDHHAALAPYLIHFNWRIGHRKSGEIIRYGECHTFRLRWLYWRSVVIPDFKRTLRQKLRAAPATAP